MPRKNRLDLTNSRLELVESSRVVDSLDFREYKSIPLNDGGVQIPFMKPKKVKKQSDYQAWKRGNVTGGSSSAPFLDRNGRYCELGKAVELGPATVQISSRQYNEFDYWENDTARIYYCFKPRLDTPSMNRVMDNVHELPIRETVAGRVEKGVVAGGSWSTTGRLPGDSSQSLVGPGQYNVFAYEAKHGPGSSNLLRFLSASSGRNVDESNRVPTKAERQRARKLLSAGSSSRPMSASGPNTDTIAGEGGGKRESWTPGISFGSSDRWNNPFYRVAPYVKTLGAKLAPDFDKAMQERERVPPKFPTMPQRYEPKRAIVDVEVNVDYGPKASLATAAATSPLRYSMAFRSKAEVGMIIPPTTSPPHLGPGAFPLRPALEISDPNRPSYAFLSPNKSSFSKQTIREEDDEPSSERQTEAFRPFSEVHTKGVTFSKDGTGAGLVQKIKTENQIKTLYPRLGKRLGIIKPPPPKVDPWAYLKPKKK